MQTESIPATHSITATFPETPFSFRPLIIARPWHAMPGLNDTAKLFAESRPARTKTARLRRLGFSGLLAAGLLLGGGARAGQSVSISWSPSTNSGTAGYLFLLSTNSGAYTSQFDVGTNTTVTITGLREGQTNYFAVAAYDSTGTPGSASPQITYLVPGLVKLTPPSAGNTAKVTFSAAIGHSYTVQASTNLTSWTNVWSSGPVNSNAWVTWQDPQGTTMSKRFYRLLMQ